MLFVKYFLQGGVAAASSEIIYKMKCLCVLTVVFMHSSVSHLVPQTHIPIIEGIKTFLGNYATINILFALSGYFFFYKVKGFSIELYKAKILERLRTLLIPYLLFCIFGFVFAYTIGDFEFSSFSSLIQKIFWGTPIIEGHPTGRAMWFIRNLIIFSLLSPIYYIIIRIFEHFTLLVCLVISLPFTGVQYDYPFFNVYLLFGAYLAIYNISFEKLYNKVGMAIPFVLMLLICSIDVLTGWFTHPDLITTCIFFFALYGLCSKMKINQFVVASTTFTYMAHMYITSILRNSFIALFPKLLVFEIIAYFLTWMIGIIVCVGIYKLLKTYAPRFLGILVGGRV